MIILSSYFLNIDKIARRIYNVFKKAEVLYADRKADENERCALLLRKSA